MRRSDPRYCSERLTFVARHAIVKSVLQHPTTDAIFDALGDGTRRKVLERLSQGPSSAGDLAAPLGVTVAAVLQHLHVLERARLVSTSKEGRVRVCRLDRAGFEYASAWIDARRREQERRLDRLADVLGESEGEHEA